jgi:hypothetical protein
MLGPKEGLEFCQRNPGKRSEKQVASSSLCLLLGQGKNGKWPLRKKPV